MSLGPRRVRTGRTGVAVLLHAALLVMGVTLPAALSAQGTCEGPGVDPWVADFRDRVLAQHDLALLAIDLYGSPVSCSGAVTAEFDGQLFGELRLGFPDDVTLSFETQPPEVSITVLEAPDGFEDGDAVRQRLVAYASDIGLNINWNQGTVVEDPNARIESFIDFTAGLNAMAQLTYRLGELSAVRLSVAP